jgi:hypothetical protein
MAASSNLTTPVYFGDGPAEMPLFQQILPRAAA